MIFHTSKFYKSVLYALTHMDMDDLVSIHNSYRKELSYEDDVIGKMSDFNDNFCGLMPLELADLISKSPMSFHTSDKYYWIDGCGKICSGNNFEGCRFWSMLSPNISVKTTKIFPTKK